MYQDSRPIPIGNVGTHRHLKLCTQSFSNPMGPTTLVFGFSSVQLNFLLVISSFSTTFITLNAQDKRLSEKSVVF